MADTFGYLQNIYSIYWGGSIYQWWFYISILSILIFEKRKNVKCIFAIYPLCCLIIILNPLTIQVVRVLAGTSNGYFLRLFALLVIPVLLSLGTTKLIVQIENLPSIKKSVEQEEKLSTPVFGKLLKMLLTGTACIIMCLFGVNVYSQDCMKPAQNPDKVPNDAIEICQKLHKDEGITIAVPESLSSYIRQIDASFYMPYGRYPNAFGMSLYSDIIEPQSIMTEAGKQACDYIVIKASEENRKAFFEAGWEPCLTTEEYFVYSVEGVPRLKKTYDQKRRLIQTTNLDANGNPQKNKNGYVTVAYEYDSSGNRIFEYYLDENNERIMIKKGYSGIKREYTLFSRKVSSMIYIDLNDKPVCIDGRFETRNQYKFENLKRRLETESYYDNTGRPMIRTDKLYASKRITYDTSGKKNGELYFDIEGKPTISSDGFAGYEQRIGKDGKEYIIYFDEEGNIISNIDEDVQTK